MAGAPVGQIDATLLTFKTRSDRPVWSEHLREPAAACRPGAVGRERLVSDTLEPVKQMSRDLLVVLAAAMVSNGALINSLTAWCSMSRPGFLL